MVCYEFHHLINDLHIARVSSENFFCLGLLEQPERQTEAGNSRLTDCDSVPSSAGRITLLTHKCAIHQFRSVITWNTSRLQHRTGAAPKHTETRAANLFTGIHIVSSGIWPAKVTKLKHRRITEAEG